MENSSSHPTQAKLAYASLIMLGLIGVIPFLLPYHKVPLTAFHSEWVAFALGMGACMPLLTKTFWLDIKIPRAAIWLFGLVILISLQALFATPVYTTQALLPGIYLAWAAVLIVISAWIREQLGLDRTITILAWLLLTGGTLQTLAGLAQYFDISGLLSVVESQQGPSVYGNISQRNHFAAQITLASFALIYLYATERLNRALSSAWLLLFAFSLTVSSSRTVVLYIVAGLLLAFFSQRAVRTPVHRRLLHGTSLLLVSFLVIQFSLPFLNDLLMYLSSAMGFYVGGFETLTLAQRVNIGGIDLRLSEWHKAWLMFLASPLWGVGIGNYGWQSFSYQTLPEFSALQKYTSFQHSHNLILQVLSELGVVGLIVLLFVVVAWLRPTLSHWTKPSYWFVFATLGILAIFSNVEFPLWYSYFLGLAAVLLGLGSEAALKVEFTPRLGQFTAGVTLLLSGSILIITFLGYQGISNVNGLVLASTPQQASMTLRAISKNPVLTPWAEEAIIHHGAPDSNMLDQQLAMATRVMHHDPRPINVNRQIIYLALAGKSTEASGLLKKLYVVYPSDFPRFACFWKLAPAEQARQLWTEAQELVGDKIKCPN